MKAKYNLTVEQNIYVAKRNIIDYIWKSANLEGIAVTFPETEAVYNGISVASLKVDEIVAINNLKYCWQFLFDTIEYPMDYKYICKVNQLVGSNLFMKPGHIRTLPVRMGGTKWVPEIPDEVTAKEELDLILTNDNITDKAITLMLWLMRKQLFLDGNKRTAMLVGNQIMISGGAGIISVPLELQAKFRELLIHYYETNNDEKIKKFVYSQCIDGIELDKLADIEEKEIELDW